MAERASLIEFDYAKESQSDVGTRLFFEKPLEYDPEGDISQALIIERAAFTGRQFLDIIDSIGKRTRDITKEEYSFMQSVVSASRGHAAPEKKENS